MRYTIQNELKERDIVNFEICFKTKSIKNIFKNKDELMTDTIKVVSILNKYSINYTMSNNYDFSIVI